MAIEEVEYWLELEGLLARFCQDLDRIMATLGALGEAEIYELLFAARDRVAGACCAVAAKPVPPGFPVSPRT